MKQSLMRPTAALLPAVLLVSARLGGSAAVSRLFFAWLLLQLCSLCSADAFRNAAAREPGVRRVDKRFSGMWLQMAAGFGLLLAVQRFVLGVNPLEMQNIALNIAALCVYIEQLFEERMFALSRRTDGVVLSVISNVLLLAGLCLDASGGVAAPVENCFTACGAGLGMVISVIANYVMEPMRAFSLVPRSIAFFPKAAVQSLLYPAAGIICVLQGWEMEFFTGMMLWRLSRTVCRRSSDESRKLNLLLMLVCAGLTAGALWTPVLAEYARGALLALVCALAVFCAPGWRVYAGAALVIAANVQLMQGFLPGEWGIYAACAACVIAVALNLHKAFLRKV